MRPLMRASALFYSALVLSSQSAEDAWQRNHKFNNRYEGLIDIPTGNPPLEVLSFTSVLQPFTRRQEWRVRYFSPEQTKVTVYARDMDSQVQYWMESTPQPASASHWSYFLGWDTGAVLMPKNVNANSVGVTVVTAGSDSIYLPAQVYPRNPTEPKDDAPWGRVDHYTLRLRANRTITRVQCEIADGTDGKPYIKSFPGVRVAGDPFPLELDMKSIPIGYKSMTIQVFNGDLPVLSRQLNFYHHSD